ncbi:hypothetical protein BKA82DRAFT_4175263, partial [Pisolithus tinctorius]
MLVTFFTLTFALGSFAGAPSNSTGCLCTYGHPCWPTADQFAELESQVSQPLIYPAPTASACYPANDPSGNCTQVMQRWTDGNWRSSIPGSMDEPNFESFVFKNGTISACSVPVIGVDARTPQDIQVAINFALRYNLKLVVKNTGHDYLGRSTGRGAFVVWTHKMKNITYDAEFAPEGAPANETYQAMTVGSGVQWHEAYDVANQNGRMMVGAQDIDGSVGAGGGWLQGGGHSSLSPSYGLGVDNVVQITVVTSTGAHLTVNNYQYPDLFWALRGGGGGTYGIVTSVTYRTYQQLSAVLYFMRANVTNATVMKELIGGMLRLQPNLTDDGWSGYGFLENATLTFIANAKVEINPFDTWYAWYTWFKQYFSTGGEDGTNMMITSRLLSRDTLANQYCRSLVSGGKVAQINPDEAGLNPAWRNAIVETVCGVSWADGTTAEEIAGKIDQLKVWIKDMYALTPQAGAYFNELKEIKDKYDPYRLFVEEWNEELTCRW